MRIKNFTASSSVLNEIPNWKMRIQTVEPSDLSFILDDLVVKYPGISCYVKKRLEESKERQNIPQVAMVPNTNDVLQKQIASFKKKYEDLKNGIKAFNFTSRQKFEESPVNQTVFQIFKNNIRTLIELETKNSEKKVQDMNLKNSQFDDLKKQIQDLTSEKNALKLQLKSEREKQTPKFEVKVIEKQASISAILQGNESLDQQIISENKKLSLMNNMMIKQKEKSKLTLGYLNQQLQDYQDKETNYLKQISDLTVLIEPVKNSENNINIDQDERDNKIAQIEANLKIQIALAQDYEIKFNNKNKQLERLNTHRISKGYPGLSLDNDSSEPIIEILEDKIREITNKCDEQQEGFKSQINTLLSKLSILEQQLNESKLKNTLSNQEKERLSQQILGLRGEIENRNTEIIYLKENIEQNSIQVTELKDKLREFENRNLYQTAEQQENQILDEREKKNGLEIINLKEIEKKYSDEIDNLREIEKQLQAEIEAVKAHHLSQYAQIQQQLEHQVAINQEMTNQQMITNQDQYDGIHENQQGDQTDDGLNFTNKSGDEEIDQEDDDDEMDSSEQRQEVIEKYEDEITILKTQLALLQQEIDSLTTHSNTIHEQQILDLNKKISQVEAERDILVERTNDLVNQLQNSNKEFLNLQNVKDSSEIELKRLIEEIKEVHQLEIEEKTKYYILNSEKEKEDFLVRIVEFEQSRKKLMDEISDLKVQMYVKKEAETTFDDIISKYEDLKKDYDYIQTNFDEIEKELEIEKKRNEKLQHELDLAHRQSIVTGDSEIEAKNEKLIRQLLDKIKAIKAVNIQNEEGLKTRIQQLEKSNLNNEKVRTGLEKQIMGLKIDNDKLLQSSRDDSEKIIEDLRAQFEKKEREIAEKLKKLLSGTHLSENNIVQLIEKISIRVDNLERNNNELLNEQKETSRKLNEVGDKKIKHDNIEFVDSQTVEEVLEVSESKVNWEPSLKKRAKMMLVSIREIKYDLKVIAGLMMNDVMLNAIKVEGGKDYVSQIQEVCDRLRMTFQLNKAILKRESAREKLARKDRSRSKSIARSIAGEITNLTTHLKKRTIEKEKNVLEVEEMHFSTQRSRKNSTSNIKSIIIDKDSVVHTPITRNRSKLMKASELMSKSNNIDFEIDIINRIKSSGEQKKKLQESRSSSKSVIKEAGQRIKKLDESVIESVKVALQEKSILLSAQEEKMIREIIQQKKSDRNSRKVINKVFQKIEQSKKQRGGRRLEFGSSNKKEEKKKKTNQTWLQFNSLLRTNNKKKLIFYNYQLCGLQ